MASLSSKIKEYLKANSITEVNFRSDVLLQDDGSGPYIKEWNIDSVSKPTDEQITSYDTAADLTERQNVVRATRKLAYGSLEDQMDMMYKDKLNGTTTWDDHIAAVKSANPIPTE